MSSTAEILREMPSRYKAGAAPQPVTYYLSIDDTRATVFVGPDGCRVESGKAVESADCVLKTTEKIFVNVVLHGKAPGPIDIARGRFKTSNPEALLKLRDMFRY
jgi:hypothetical protein